MSEHYSVPRELVDEVVEMFSVFVGQDIEGLLRWAEFFKTRETDEARACGEFIRQGVSILRGKGNTRPHLETSLIGQIRRFIGACEQLIRAVEFDDHERCFSVDSSTWKTFLHALDYLKGYLRWT